MSPCCTLRGDFYESMRPSSRWVLLTRILFAPCTGLGQQTQGVSPSQEEFSLIARLLISSGARDVPSLGKRTMITLYRR